MKKMRLDNILVDRGYFPDEDASLRAVLAREVRVDDVYQKSAAVMVSPNADIFVKGRNQYVSRGGHKLEAALKAFGQSVQRFHCLDAGASTGGFTDCLLQNGAASVVCVDVNYGQLAWKLRQDERVNVFERLNIKQADPTNIGAPFNLIVADLSFIGLAQLAPVFARFAKDQTVFIGLIKPQFESRIGETEGGVVRDDEVRHRVIEEVETALEAACFEPTGVIESPIQGPAGNIEYLVRAVFRSSN